MKKHVGVLERAGLVTDWIEGHRRLWAARFDALDDVLEGLETRK